MKMRKISLCGEWSLAVANHGEHSDYTASCQIKEEVISAKVPGNVELDLFAAGKVGDLFFGENPDSIRRLTERLHCYYFKTFTVDAIESEPILRFEGLDCYAEVFINGILVGSYDNMLIEHETDISAALKVGENEIFVHIRPAVVEAQKYDYNPLIGAGATAYEQLYVRKPAHMFGWDILPRYVSAGIWKPVDIIFEEKEGIKEFYLNTTETFDNNKWASVQFFYKLKADITGGETLTLRGVCKDSVVEEKWWLCFSAGMHPFRIENPQLWWPRSYGEPNQYDWELIFERNGEEIETFKFKQGIRECHLDATEIIDDDGKGEFRFFVNGQPIYCKGTNWVAADPFHSRDKERIPAMLQCAVDCNCNMIRCWGGNVYEDDIFYEICDREGIMVWQDFGMACAKHPQDPEFLARMREEAKKVVKRLRHHACITLWAGDNESDSRWLYWETLRVDPNKNKITRQVLPDVLFEEDPCRSYLPSSPYASPSIFRMGWKYKPEEHYYGWGTHYKDMETLTRRFKFVSEFGIMSCPSPDSVKKFISPEYLWNNNGENDEWALHSVSSIPEFRSGQEKAFRIGIHRKNIELFFDEPANSLADFARKDQIQQLEGTKYTVEYYRAQKWNKTGILWWNLMDGWPQLSEAVVDYYFDKKLAFYGMAVSQKDVCLVMLDEKDGKHQLFLCNDTAREVELSYTVKDVETNEIIAEGKAKCDANYKALAAEIPASPKKRMLLIEWKGDTEGANHFLDAKREKINIDWYLDCLSKTGIYTEWLKKQKNWD